MTRGAAGNPRFPRLLPGTLGRPPQLPMGLTRPRPAQSSQLGLMFPLVLLPGDAGWGQRASAPGQPCDRVGVQVLLKEGTHLALDLLGATKPVSSFLH